MNTRALVLDALPLEALAALRHSLGARFTVAGTASSDAVPAYLIRPDHPNSGALPNHASLLTKLGEAARLIRSHDHDA